MLRSRMIKVEITSKVQQQNDKMNTLNELDSKWFILNVLYNKIKQATNYNK